MNYYENIKEILINNEVTKKVKDYSKNKSDLESYYNVGKLLVEAQGGEARAKYGEGLIKKFSLKLTDELGKKYSVTLLKYMRKFYLLQKSQTLSDQITWSHYMELLPLKDIYEIKYYINQIKKYNLSIRELREKIKNKEYERLPEATKSKINTYKETKIQDLVKHPIIINSNGKEILSEKILQKLILENIENFLKELGNGFSYVASEYKIKVGDRYNYLDLLLFNIIYNCYVVVELKVTELRKEYFGQIQVYMNYIDKHLKTDNMNNTIGILLVKENNEYVLYSSDGNIITRTFKLTNN